MVKLVSCTIEVLFMTRVLIHQPALHILLFLPVRASLSTDVCYILLSVVTVIPTCAVMASDQLIDFRIAFICCQ